MTPTPPMPEWPKKPERSENIPGISVGKLAFPEGQVYFVQMLYERAMKEAAMERLRVAVEALNLAAMTIGCSCACIRCKTTSDRVHKALNDIGEVPHD